RARTGRPETRLQVRRRGPAGALVVQRGRNLRGEPGRAELMRAWHIIQGVNDALRLEMRRDPRVVVLGEDVGKFGGVFRATLGLQEELGADRCVDTPPAESGIIGAAIGMALYGLRPVPEIQFADFIYPAYDQ